ncbi:MAG: hypothetical protein IJ833_01835 [Lachnospiraceae bacterium]|nr:hypothetical protein [Lachnospiraceae bacterium]
MEREKLLYICGIDWEWIYQRPQILAEKLSEDYDVTVVFPRSIMSRNKTIPRKANMSFRILWTLPYQEKNGLIGKIASALSQKIFADIHQFAYIYVGYPLYARYIPQDYSGKLLYDCMDDHDVLYPDQKRVERIQVQERRLIKRCDCLVVSSMELKKKADGIAGADKSVLIRNAVTIKDICAVQPPCRKERYRLAYIGTISDWFDYEPLKQSLAQLEQIEYCLIGPAKNRAQVPGISYAGVVPHEQLSDTIGDVDCLLMPFQVNEIVQAVDPVKLYEYIAFGKCIISVFYPEIERFGAFVYFYRTAEEYTELVRELADKGFPPKYSERQQKEFLEENTWEKRYQLLKKILFDISGRV